MLDYILDILYLYNFNIDTQRGCLTWKYFTPKYFQNIHIV
jgi:hypothetical protein